MNNPHDPLATQIYDKVAPQHCDVEGVGVVRAYHNQRWAWMQNAGGSFRTQGFDMSRGDLPEALVKQYQDRLVLWVEDLERQKELAAQQAQEADGKPEPLMSSDPEPNQELLPEDFKDTEQATPELPPLSDTAGLGQYNEPVPEAFKEPPSDVPHEDEVFTTKEEAVKATQQADGGPSPSPEDVPQPPVGTQETSKKTRTKKNPKSQPQDGTPDDNQDKEPQGSKA